MNEFIKAPYLELNDYKAPKGANFIFIPMEDGKKIRLAYWKQTEEKNKSSGTILLQQGHNEFIEKYYETIQELIDRNFNVISFDWRGQGMSDRMINNIHKQYIEDYSTHDKDLLFIFEKFIKNNFSKPIIGIGHSMGGHLLLSSLEILQQNFKGLILSAPMLGFKYERILFNLSNLVNLTGKKDSFFPGSRPNFGKETPFDQNDLTNDYNRYIRTQKLVRLKPDIRLWGVTNAWVKAAKQNLFRIRKKGWIEKIETKIYIINPIKDKVVDSKKTTLIANRLPNCELLNLDDVQHEIFMEKDIYRDLMWKKLDNFLKELI